MKKTIISTGVALILAVLALSTSYAETPTEYKAQYAHNVNVMSLKLSMTVDNIYTIEGEFFSKMEDNLTMTDSEGQVVRKMADNYNLVSQNDHVISGGNVEYIAKGLIKVGADSYDVYVDEEKVAYVKFNLWDTEGILYNAEGVKIAQYTSGLLMSDYTVSIFEECSIADEDILMFFASYVSDKRADD